MNGDTDDKVDNVTIVQPYVFKNLVQEILNEICDYSGRTSAEKFKTCN